jgi:hypothetical protein
MTIVIGFNATGIQGSYLATYTPTGSYQPWTGLPGGLTPGYKEFYTVLPAVMGTETQQGASGPISIPVDTTGITSSTVIKVYMWVTDLQIPAHIADGQADSAPTAYYPVSAYGVTATVFTNGFTISANIPASQLIHINFTSF